MYSVNELFDKRSVVGARLEQLIEEKKYTKAELCRNAGVSRPTLDKVLAGTLGSETNYTKHISKILKCLAITPDRLLGNIENVHSRVRGIKNIMKISSEQVTEMTGITLERLRELEGGKKATLAELRDIAASLSVGVNDILGENFFETQVSELELFLQCDKKDEDDKLRGFWGYIGILLQNTDKYLWYPITGGTRKQVYDRIHNEKLVIPCMNNKVLFLNKKNVKEILILDESCDLPDFANCDNKVNCGEIPYVIYETLQDFEFLDNEELLEDKMSDKFQKYMRDLIKREGWGEEKIYEMINHSIIYFGDGKERVAAIDFEWSSDITDSVQYIYECGEDLLEDNIWELCDLNGTEIILNLDNVSMVEMPLVNVNDAIIKEINSIE